VGSGSADVPTTTTDDGDNDDGDGDKITGKHDINGARRERMATSDDGLVADVSTLYKQASLHRWLTS
jgi:hypothetical protein